MTIISKSIFILIFPLLFVSCEEEEKIMPRPIGQLRVEFPKHEYKQAELGDCPYSFEIPQTSVIRPGMNPDATCHKNLELKKFNATLYISYYTLDTTDVNSLIKESRDKVYEHVVKANSIDEIMLKDSVNKVYGILYDIKGNAATPFQFFLTDSSKNFIRASLMFNSQANYDSLKPMIKYLKVDLENMISTTEWLVD
jgi:gliding motility-associated lipoprotein GldD